MSTSEAELENPWHTPEKKMPDSPLHQKLSSRSRKSVEDIMEDSKRRQAAADALLASQRSARQQKLQSERKHEQEVKERNESHLTELEQTTARKQAHAEEMRQERLKQQAERLRKHDERAEAIRQRKLSQPAEEGVPSDIPAGTALARGDDNVEATVADADDENLLIDLPWTMFGEKPGTPQKGGASGIDATPPRDNPLHAKLSSRSRKTVEEVMQLSERRMEAAKSAKARLFQEHEQKIQKEHERAEAVAARKQQAIDEVQQSSARRMAQAEEHRALKLKEQKERLQKEQAKAEEVRRRRRESPEKAPPSDATETPAGSPTPGAAEKAREARDNEKARRAEVLKKLAEHEKAEFKADMPTDAEGKPLVMEIKGEAWTDGKLSARGIEMHEKLSSRTRKAPEQVLDDHKRRMAAAEALRRAREAKEKQRLEREREKEDQVRIRIETNAEQKSQKAATKSDEKMRTADAIARRKAARESLRAERKRQREKSAKARQQNAVRTFGSTMLDDDDKLRLLKVVKENKLAELEEMATGGELGRLRNFQNHYGDSALILAAWYGHLDIAKLLLDVNADVDIANCDGNTALNCAAYRGHHQMVELLLIEGSEVDVQDNVTGKTALIKAAYGGHTKVVQMLLEAEADPDAIDSQGYGALAFAASFGHREVLQALLEYDADPDVADQFGITPLIHAAARGDFLSVKLLLEAGAAPTKEDVEGKSAIDYADSAGFDDVVHVLTEYAEKDPNCAGQLQSSAGAVTQRIAEAEGGNGTVRGAASSREYSLCATDRNRQMSDRAYAPAYAPESQRGTARGGNTARLTPRMPPPLPSNRPRVPLGGVGNDANALGTPRGFRGMKAAPPAPANSALITPADMMKVDGSSMTYLAKKLFNLSILLEQDTVSEDIKYPVFAC